MEDRSFFDLIYQQWSKTTGASDTFWGVEAIDNPDEQHGGNYLWDVYAMDQDQKKQFLGSFRAEEDADFIAAIHGCLPDLVRRLHMAVDESDRLDYDADSRECRIAELEMEVQELKEKLEARG